MMDILLLQTTLTDYAQWGIAGAIVFLIVVVLAFLLKALPTWKEVRLAEIKVREKEADSRAAQATSFGELSGALSTIGNVLNNVAIEQRHATEKVQLLQRVNADTSERAEEKVDQLIEIVEQFSVRLDSFEGLIGKK